jgi:hypothetical protein
VSRFAPDTITAASVDAAHLTLLLSRHGWTMRGGQDRVYSKWVIPEAPDWARRALIVPLDPARGDYTELMREAVNTLSRLAAADLEPARSVITALVAPGDEIRFVKNVPVRGSGAIPWARGEEVFAAARASLVAAAKARLSRRAYYGNAHGRFANRFMDDVLMGQTDIGSFVVTAYAPPDERFPERTAPTVHGRAAADLGYTGREITEMLASGVRRAQEASSAYRVDEAPQVFEEAVQEGVSRELVEALARLAAGGEGAEVRIEWAPQAQLPLLGESAPPPPMAVHLTPEDARTFERVAPYLATLEPTAYVRLIGWVSLVSRPSRRQSGVVRLRVVQGSEARSVQVRLTANQYELAAGAVTRDQGIAVSGRLEKEGNRYWLYDVTDIHPFELPPLPEAGTSVRAANQSLLFDADADDQ